MASAVEIDERTLADNAARLTRADLAGQLRRGQQTSALGKVEADRTDTGALCLRLASRAICSGRDPVAEAERWVERQQLEGIDLLVVLGLGAGHQIDALMRRNLPLQVVIIEPHPEVIRQVLGARGKLDWRDVRIVESATALRIALVSLMRTGDRVTIQAWPPARRLYGDYWNGVLAAAAEACELTDVTLRTMYRRAKAWVDHLLQNLVRLPGCVPANNLGGWLAGRPAIVVSAGPSLDLNVAELARVDGRAVIITVNTALRALERAGIRADLVVALEALDISEMFAALDVNGHTPRALSLTSHPALFRTDAPLSPFIDRHPSLARFSAALGFGEGIPVGGSVSCSAFAMMRLLGASQLVLIGQDLAYSGNKVYAAGSPFEEMAVAIGADGQAKLDNLEAKRRFAAGTSVEERIREQEDVVQVPAWGGGEPVWTNLAFNYFRFVLEAWAAERPDAELINATEGGARIEGFAERPLADVIDALPAPPTDLSFPSEPALTAAGIDRVLSDELRVIQRAGAEARTGARGADDRALARVRRELGASGLLSMHCWSILVDTISDESIGGAELCRRLAEATDEAAEAVQRARKELASS